MNIDCTLTTLTEVPSYLAGCPLASPGLSVSPPLGLAWVHSGLQSLLFLYSLSSSEVGKLLPVGGIQPTIYFYKL